MPLTWLSTSSLTIAVFLVIAIIPDSLPASLIFVAIALFVYVAVSSPATLVALPPLPSFSPATLIAIIIALATLALALFITR